MPTPQLNCIYCRNSTGEPSAEHVLADGLGGSIKLPITAVCKACNNKINEDVDRPVQKDLLPILALLSIPGKYGATPRWEVEEIVGGEKRRLEIDGGSVRPVEKRKLLERTPNEYSFRASSREELERVRQEIAAKNPGKRVVLSVEGPVELELPNARVDYLDFDVDHWSRWAAKTALNTISYMLGVASAVAPEYDALRAYALNGGARPDGLRVGGCADDILQEDDLVAEHELTITIERGKLLVTARLFGFCGMEIVQTTPRQIHCTRRIVLDAGSKCVAMDTK